MRSSSTVIGTSFGFTGAPGRACICPLTTTRSSALMPETIDRSSPNSAPSSTGRTDDLVVLVHDEHVPLALVVADGRVGHEQRVIPPAARHSHAAKKPGVEQPVWFFSTPRTRIVPVVGIDVVVDEVDDAFVREARFVAELRRSRALCHRER